MKKNKDIKYIDMDIKQPTGLITTLEKTLQLFRIRDREHTSRGLRDVYRENFLGHLYVKEYRHFQYQNGKPGINLLLSDEYGTDIKAIYWGEVKDYIFEQGSIKAEGLLQLINNEVQLTLTAPPIEGTLEKIEDTPPFDKWMYELNILINMIQNTKLLMTVQQATLKNIKFCESPASYKAFNYNKYGLLRHTLNVISIARSYALTFQTEDIRLNIDLIIAAAAVYNIGIIDEVYIKEDNSTVMDAILKQDIEYHMEKDTTPAYKKQRTFVNKYNKLRTTSYKSCEMFRDIAQLNSVKEEIMDLILHIIQAVHGEQEPMCTEAFIVKQAVEASILKDLLYQNKRIDIITDSPENIDQITSNNILNKLTGKINNEIFYTPKGLNRLLTE